MLRWQLAETAGSVVSDPVSARKASKAGRLLRLHRNRTTAVYGLLVGLSC
jgi:hypothetical protein